MYELKEYFIKKSGFCSIFFSVKIYICCFIYILFRQLSTPIPAPDSKVYLRKAWIHIISLSTLSLDKMSYDWFDMMANGQEEWVEEGLEELPYKY